MCVALLHKLFWQGRQFGNQLPDEELNIDIQEIRHLLDTDDTSNEGEGK